MNLCTDQLAMMLAAPGQLVSVSHLASEVQSSSMVEEARAYPANRGQVEQVFLMRPDLVLAGTYTQVSTVDLLRRLGVEVVQVPPATSLAEAVEQIRIVGQVLGQDEKANAVADRFSAEIATARFEGPPRSAAFYYPNGYTTGSGTLANEVVELTGFANIGATSGVTGGGYCLWNGWSWRGQTLWSRPNAIRAPRDLRISCCIQPCARCRMRRVCG